MLPNFLVIGPGKSGTTWMYHALKQHPEVCVSTAKETLFFETEFFRGLDWYKGFFSHCNEDAKAIGEVSNTYIFCDEAPGRIRSVNPDMKLITCLRNPVERTFSHYLFLLRGGRISGSFREVLEQEGHLIERGKYYKNLKPYFDEFNDDQLFIKLFGELKEDQTAFIQSIYNFLNVNNSFIPKVDQENRLSASKPRSRWLAWLVKKGARMARYFGYPQLISKVKYTSIPKLLYKEYGKEEKPTISEEDRDYLIDQFSEDIDKLSSRLEINLNDKWFN